MYRLLLTVCCFLSLLGSSYSQPFHAALKAGIAATQVSGDNLGGYDKAGVAGGGVVGINLSQKLNLNLEILFIQKGSRKNANPDKEDYEAYLLRLNYFEFPLLLQWKYKEKLGLEAGPSLGVLISSSEEDFNGAIPNPRPFNQTEFGINGGVQYAFTKNLSLCSRIASSLLPIRKHLSGQTYRWNKGQYNAVLLFALQYSLGKK